MGRPLSWLFVLTTAGAAFGGVMTDPGIQVGHNGQYNGWRGFNNNAYDGTPWLSDWGDNDDWGTNTYSDHALVGFDRQTIRDAITSTVDQYGGWDAYLLVTYRLMGDPPRRRARRGLVLRRRRRTVVRDRRPGQRDGRGVHDRGQPPLVDPGVHRPDRP